MSDTAVAEPTGALGAEVTATEAPQRTESSTATSATTTDTTTSTATTAEGAAAEAAGATPEQVAMIEGRLNGQPYQFPKDAQIPWKRGNEQGFATLEEIQRGHMFHRDYQAKTATLANDRRALEETRVEVETLRRQMDAERAVITKEQQRHFEAMTSSDPEVRARYERHLDMLAQDPEYRERYEKSLKLDALEARDSFRAELDQRQHAQAVADDIDQTIAGLTPQYPGVDVERVLQRYERVLEQEGEKALTPRRLKQCFDEEAAAYSQATQPFKSELDALRAELAELKRTGSTAAKAEQHNTRVRTAIATNTSAARTTPATGRSAAPGMSAPAKTAPRSRQDAHLAFIRGE